MLCEGTLARLVSWGLFLVALVHVCKQMCIADCLDGTIDPAWLREAWDDVYCPSREIHQCTLVLVSQVLAKHKNPQMPCKNCFLRIFQLKYNAGIIAQFYDMHPLDSKLHIWKRLGQQRASYGFGAIVQLTKIMRTVWILKLIK